MAMTLIRTWKFNAICGVLVSVAHFILTGLAFMKSELIQKTATTEFWKHVFLVLSFPANSVPSIASSDANIGLIFGANSAVIGIFFGTTIYFIGQKTS
jgi:asparagine N-glycosylation enzyme membrane subunit Stt3